MLWLLSEKKNRNAAEAGMKVFLLGALSSALIIYGLALFYGATGSFEFGSGVLLQAQILLELPQLH